ncbi:uncharacterized protein DSM5745_07555 [Aspergillus mulundensis]|uniref:LysM domain-containing protein n=1 Tax=Aspergillus mulundensis TaxID=1810919 RepID=A0A3D8RE89_9EURO|nr:Uncharacterized protein DSM5745_07555 [Aspergillus mulundensis]RDW72383.1 Uncharacterized protein DSM5745_07555 [Aspergillus mulundensis]
MKQFLTFSFLGTALGYAHRKRQDGPVDSSTSPDCTWYDTALDSSYDCAYFESMWALTHEQFVSYNPSVEDDCSGIVVGNSYCVEVNYGTPLPTPTTAEPTATASPKPSPTQEGLADTCTAFYMAATGDSCQKIVDKYRTFTVDDFLTWNPAVGEDCAGLWAEYYYCVGVPGTPTTPLPTPTTTPTPTGPSPTQDGIVENCTTFYQAAKGDTCQKIVSKYGTFTQEDLITWNPALGDDCSGLWAEYYYCVGVPGSPTTRPTTSTSTSTATTSSGPSPTQTGIIGTCTSFQKAVKGDTCAAIAQEHGTFTLDEFLEWNPAVGSDCSGLQIGYYYCVGIPGTPTEPPATTTTATNPGCTSAPTPTQPGVSCSCKKWHKVVSGDTCASIQIEYNISVANFNKWNPGVGSDCSTLWLGYNVCVRM